MARLERPIVAAAIDPPDRQLIDAIASAGLPPPVGVVMDGQIHRFRTAPGKDKSGWYVAYGDGVPAGAFGDWRTGVSSTWIGKSAAPMTAEMEEAHRARMVEIKAIRELETKQRRQLAASVVFDIWEALDEAPADHPYLVRKGVSPHGTRVTGDGRLVCPLFDLETGELASLQYIDEHGGKLYHHGGETRGKAYEIGEETSTVYVVEGFATGATVHEETGAMVVVAYSASNLPETMGTVRTRYPKADVVIVADNDKSGTGQRYADQAIATHGGRYVVPPDLGDANDYRASGKDLKALLAPPLADWLIAADDFASQPSPISWLVKGWLQAQALIMVHGPSGGGKTFVVLDWCLRMACGMGVKPGSVVYLAGEGHHGLRGRIAAWKEEHKPDKALSMWLSRDGLDLNTPAGLRKTIDNVRTLPTTPTLIVIDTLHRFLAGDENSAQDAKTMLDACAALQIEFGCSVLLVHHTGVNEEAQARARGSSAWRGALDIEISVIPAKGDTPIQVVQRKSKDSEVSEPFFCSLKSVVIPGWVDEDGLPVTSAIVERAEAPQKAEKESALSKHRKAAENAWWGTGCEMRDGKPYVSRAGLRSYLCEHMGWKDTTTLQHLKPSAAPGMLIRDLLDCGFFHPADHGWVVIDQIRSHALLSAKVIG